MGASLKELFLGSIIEQKVVSLHIETFLDLWNKILQYSFLRTGRCVW